MLIRVLWLAALCVLCIPSIASARPGDLDPTFGGGDGVAVDTADDSLVGGPAAVQSDGKILVVGRTEHRQDLALSRFLPDGTPDPGFGQNGLRLLPFGEEAYLEQTAVATFADKTVIAAENSEGYTSSVVQVMRLDLSGELDPSFSGDGLATLEPGRDTDLCGVAATPEGGVLAAGDFRPASASGRRAFVARLEPDGSLDSQYGANGIASIELERKGLCMDLAAGPNSSLALAGNLYGGDPDQGWIARFTSSGSLDQDFSGDGSRVVGVGRLGFLDAIETAPDGGVLALGTHIRAHRGGYPSDLLLMRLRGDGSFAKRFGPGGRPGVVRTDLNKADSGRDLILDDSNRIVVAGYTKAHGGSTDLALLRYRLDGGFDQRFSGNGRHLVELGKDEDPESVGLYPGGRILVSAISGYSYPERDVFDQVVLRFEGRP